MEAFARPWIPQSLCHLLDNPEEGVLSGRLWVDLLYPLAGVQTCFQSLPFVVAPFLEETEPALGTSLFPLGEVLTGVPYPDQDRMVDRFAYPAEE